MAGLISGLTCQAQFLTTGIPTVTLSLTGVDGSTPMTLAWHPGYEQYYGGRGGNSSYGGIVWDVTGAVVQIREPINIDIRSINYNAVESRLEIVSYNAVGGTGDYGYKIVSLDEAGLFTGNYSPTGVSLSTLPSGQTAPAFDAMRNVLYGYDSGNQVRVIDATNGQLLSTLTLDLTAAGTTFMNTYVIAYAAGPDALLGFTTTGGNRVVAFAAATGEFLGSVMLPELVSPVTSWGMAYANDQVFIFDNALDAYRGFALVPEPGTWALLLSGLGLVCWQVIRRRNRRA